MHQLLSKDENDHYLKTKTNLSSTVMPSSKRNLKNTFFTYRRKLQDRCAQVNNRSRGMSKNNRSAINQVSTNFSDCDSELGKREENFNIIEHLKSIKEITEAIKGQAPPIKTELHKVRSLIALLPVSDELDFDEEKINSKQLLHQKHLSLVDNIVNNIDIIDQIMDNIKYEMKKLSRQPVLIEKKKETTAKETNVIQRTPFKIQKKYRVIRPLTKRRARNKSIQTDHVHAIATRKGQRNLIYRQTSSDKCIVELESEIKKHEKDILKRLVVTSDVYQKRGFTNLNKKLIMQEKTTDSLVQFQNLVNKGKIGSWTSFSEMEDTRSIKSETDLISSEREKPFVSLQACEEFKSEVLVVSSEERNHTIKEVCRKPLPKKTSTMKGKADQEKHKINRVTTPEKGKRNEAEQIESTSMVDTSSSMCLIGKSWTTFSEVEDKRNIKSETDFIISGGEKPCLSLQVCEKFKSEILAVSFDSTSCKYSGKICRDNALIPERSHTIKEVCRKPLSKKASTVKGKADQEKHKMKRVTSPGKGKRITSSNMCLVGKIVEKNLGVDKSGTTFRVLEDKRRLKSDTYVIISEGEKPYGSFQVCEKFKPEVLVVSSNGTSCKYPRKICGDSFKIPERSRTIKEVCRKPLPKKTSTLKGKADQEKHKIKRVTSPENGKRDKADQIKSASITDTSSNMCLVESLKDLIRKLIIVDPKQKFSIDQALNHHFFQKLKEEEEINHFSGKRSESQKSEINDFHFKLLNKIVDCCTNITQYCLQ